MPNDTYVIFKNLLQLCTMVLLGILNVQSLIFESSQIARFACNKSQLIPEHACFGSYILPNLVLTTSFCAKSCFSVNNQTILRRYIRNHYQNYVCGESYRERNDIGLVQTLQKNTHFFQLSALDHTNSVGRITLVPIMKNPPLLQTTFVQPCVLDHAHPTFGYYICVINKITNKSVEVCQSREREQGIPLLLNKRILGVMGIKARESCYDPQRRFIAIAPTLSWISNITKQLTIEIAIRMENPTSIAQNDFSKKEIIHNPNKMAAVSNTEKQVIDDALKIIESLKNKVRTRPFSQTFQITRGTIAKQDADIKVTHQTTMKPYAETTLKAKIETAITFIPRGTPPKKKTETTTVRDTTRAIPLFINFNNKSTNLMDWFNDHVKQKLRMSEAPVYILTTPSTIRWQVPNFVDLT